MNLKTVFTFFVLLTTISLHANEISIKELNYAGPYAIKKPFMTDTLDLNNKKYEEKDLLKNNLSFTNLEQSGTVLTANSANEITLPSSSADYALHLLSFYLHSDRYGEGELVIEGLETAEVYVNNELKNSSVGTTKLIVEPKSYHIIVKLLTLSGQQPTVKMAFKPEKDLQVLASSSSKRQYMLSDVTDGKRIQSASISPDGKYVIVNYLTTLSGGSQFSHTEIVDRSNGHSLMRREGAATRLQWMPKSAKAYYTRQGLKGRELVTVDPTNGGEVVLASNLPDGGIRIAPTEDFLLVSIQETGPEERRDLQQILEPDDRQPGWRNRSFIHKYDLKTGLLERLTFGHLSAGILDISKDGRFLLFANRERVLTERPFARINLYLMDLTTGDVETIFENKGFINGAYFSPDAKQLLIYGSGETFDNVGLKINPGQTSSTSDGQLFIFNLADRKVKPLTVDFNPSIDNYLWNAYDNMIYAMAKDRDYVRIYSIDPVKDVIRELSCNEEVVSSFSLATSAPTMVYFGMGASNSLRLHAKDLKKNNDVCLIDLSAEILKDIELGEVKDWNFISSFGDTIYGRYYLPPHFDPNKQYPLIVNYYGGVTPTARTLENRYSSHVYAGMGFVVYIVQPSGATGFGQEFSARHVNAWGKMTADEIIEGTKKFCEAHSFVNKDKIGCMGASYGGFMTMYLQTKTDIFAAAMSHAGISDITGYWGEGYWGYSYSDLASANSYPWNATEMYVGQSPLYSADKINTPILFLHGAADTNVPISESIQMFTALKLLGKETAFVQVAGEDHHILDYDKRIRWNNSIYAWFFKWLKDDSTWWDALYPQKNL
ncbi:prolyl oligopeptidase family serine peptidase [Parabacteroides sp. OttesenSCG-928-G07]|nr:prolyl oligopeptidase family serine peptidase [Parabacteroides sp. OttesenSCG-928-G07]